MRTKAIIYIDRFLRNFYAVKDRIGQTRICVPVKADAYGHGAAEIAKISLEAGAFCLGVATVTEGSELRKAGINSPILIFSQPHHEEIPEIIRMKLIPFISDIDFTDALNRHAEMKENVQPVHIKIDTGMGRLGCLPEEALTLARRIVSSPGLELAGTATHFAVADSTDPQDIAFTHKQLADFKKAVTSIRNEGIDPGIVHAANSGAVILHPDSWLDMVRPGIFLYGYKAVEEKNSPPEHYGKLADLMPLHAQPVMELRTTVTMIKKISKGETVSYGRTWTAPQDTHIAILPIGYADGLPRLASGKWQAVIGGKTYPIVGRITMDQCCVDIGAEPTVKRWREAIIFGGGASKEASSQQASSPQASSQFAAAEKSAADLAAVTGTIPYEITCNINKRVPRVYEAYGVAISINNL
ncbi:MAG: alanine racemase [Treponema sp.]|nr:alanine racemase [Treponema sp.]